MRRVATTGPGDMSTTAKQERAAEDVAQSAEAIEDAASQQAESAVQQVDSADRRTELAANRTVLAAERTYAAWVRTGLAALASGVGAQALLEDAIPGWLSRPTASTLILFSAFCFMAAVWRELRPGAAPPKPDTRRLPPAFLIAVNGFLTVVSLTALVGIWLQGA